MPTIHQISAASVNGLRSYQEDAIYFSSSALAVSDGFGKGDLLPNNSGERSHSGYLVSSKVIEAVKEFDSRLRNHTTPINQDIVRQLYNFIDHRTHQSVAGATLALVIMSDDMLYCSALGDSLVSIQIPGKTPTITPGRNLHLSGSKLWGCFGDRLNRKVHRQSPEIYHSKVKKGQIVLVCSDGLIASDDPLTIRARIQRCLHMIQDGALAFDLIHHSLTHFGSTDNISVAFWVL